VRDKFLSRRRRVENRFLNVVPVFILIFCNAYNNAILKIIFYLTLIFIVQSTIVDHSIKACCLALFCSVIAILASLFSSCNLLTVQYIFLFRCYSPNLLGLRNRNIFIAFLFLLVHDNNNASCPVVRSRIASRGFSSFPEGLTLASG